MSEIRSYNRLLPLISLSLVLALTAVPARSSALRPKAPVFVRDASGRFVNTGEWRKAPADSLPLRREFAYDRPSMRRSMRRMLGSGSVPPVVEGTIRVVLIRIAFESNSEPQNTSITTGGDFDLTPGGTSLIDPTPHNRTYFDSHMQGLRNYIGFQSCGRLEVEWEILPREENESYKLSDIADYGPGSGGNWTTPQLARFMYDAVTEVDGSLASEGYPVRLSDYDAIILVHAGADLQSDIMADSPNDIPSFFAVLGDGDRIPIEGGSAIVTEVSVVPETATQDGQFGSLSSVLAHEFGHVLGLPDLYDISYGMPVVGVWDQMDSGPQIGLYLVDGEEEIYAVGILPSGLGAWSRYMLGWVDVETVATFDGDISLSAVEKCPSKVVRVDISNDEFFLIENRACRLDDEVTQPIFDPVTGVMTGWGRCLNCDDPDAGELEWEPVNAYDLLLPTESDAPSVDGGPGLLVWHVDEHFVADRWERNEVNSRWPFGVSLVEANGITDLGNPYSRYRMGWYDDAFFEGNGTVMSDSTFPSAWSNWGVPSGVRLERVSARDTSMTFGAGVRAMIHTEPFDPPVDIPPHGRMALPGRMETVIAGRYGDLHVAGREEAVFPAGSGIRTPMAYAPGFDADTEEDALVFADTTGALHALSAADWEYCAGSWPYEAGAVAVSPVAVYREGEEIYLAATFSDGTIRLIDGSGTEAGDRAYAPEGFSFTGNIAIDSGLTGGSGSIYALCRSAGMDMIRIARYVRTAQGLQPALGGWDWSAPMNAAGSMALLGGDLDPASEGTEMVVASISSGEVMVCDGLGELSRTRAGGRLTGAPALQDMNGDTWTDIVFSDGWRIFAISVSGANITGWPRDINRIFDLPTSVRVTTPVTTATTTDEAWVVAGTDAGIIFVFDHTGELAPGYPARFASYFDQEIGLYSEDGDLSLEYIDVVDNRGINPFHSFRPPNASARWRSSGLGAFSGSNSWGVALGGTDRSAWAGASGGFETAPAAWTSLAEVMTVYPNPSTSGKVRVHFTAPSSGSAEIQVMTLTGELVHGAVKELAGGEDEFEVDMGGKASGIYLCRLVVRSEGKTLQATRKFAHLR